MKSGHVGIFRGEGKARLPIEELRGSRALLHQSEAQGVADRGDASFARLSRACCRPRWGTYRTGHGSAVLDQIDRVVDEVSMNHMEI